MTTRQTPGSRLKRLLDSTLDGDTEWSEHELVMVDKAAKAEDRAAALQGLLDDELTHEQPSSRKVTELAGEIRQLEGVVVKIVGMLTSKADAPSAGATTAPPPAEGAATAPPGASQATYRDRRSHRRKTAPAKRDGAA